MHEHTDRKRAMYLALKELNEILRATIDQTGYSEMTLVHEAETVERTLEHLPYIEIQEAWLIDHLTQAVIDLNRVAPAEIKNIQDRTAEDFEHGTDDYYAQLALDTRGSAIRDNSRAERIQIGRNIDECPECQECKECPKHD